MADLTGTIKVTVGDDPSQVEIISMSSFREKNGNITHQALQYAMEKDQVDYILEGNTRMVVMTAKSLCYKPNKSKKRPASADAE